MKEINIDEPVGKELESVRRIISQTGLEASVSEPRLAAAISRVAKGRTLYTAIVDELSAGSRNTEPQIAYLRAFEEAVACFRAASLQLRTEMDVLTLEGRLAVQQRSVRETSPATPTTEIDPLKKKITDAVFFSNRYALYFAGHIGLALLNSERASTETLFTFTPEHDASQNRDELSTLLSRETLRAFTKVVGGKKEQPLTDEDLKYSLEGMFTFWIDQFNWSTFKDIARKQDVDEVRLKYRNYSVQAGEFKRKYSTVTIDDRFMPVTRDEVIGSERFGEVLWGNLKKLSAYDPERRKNPHKPAFVVFTYGEPGGGKTFTSHAYIRSFGELCRTKGIPLWAFTHSTTDYASEYQNKTANELANLATRMRDFPGIVVCYVADADTVFQSRQRGDLTVEQQQTLSVYLKMFDGTLVPKNGKTLFIMDANTLEGIDDATKSRVFDEIVELERFKRPEDFAELARRKLTKGYDGIVITDPEWLAVGQYLLKSPLSNREIDHVLRGVQGKYEVPDELIGAAYEQHEALRRTHVGSMTQETILGKFDEYIRTRMEMERKAYESLRRNDVSRFLEAVERQGGDTTASGAKTVS